MTAVATNRATWTPNPVDVELPVQKFVPEWGASNLSPPEAKNHFQAIFGPKLS